MELAAKTETEFDQGKKLKLIAPFFEALSKHLHGVQVSVYLKQKMVNRIIIIREVM